jgi:heme o synthase
MSQRRENVTAVAVENATGSRTRLVRDFVLMTKPEITFLVTISALAGFLLGSRETLDGWTLLWALVGIPLTSAGGAVLNHYRERQFDALMHRTASRPIPAGRVRPEHARLFAYLLIMAGMGILCPLTNPLTGVLAGIALVLYVYVYTPMKRVTPFNTLLGTIPGALPALGGWTAATGSLGMGGWAIFLVLMFWQMPHFMSLAWMYRKDYERAGFVMWTVSDDAGNLTVALTVGFSALMVLASLLPFFLSLSGVLYAVGALALGLWFLIPVYRFAGNRSVRNAKSILKASVIYIPVLLLFIVLDGFIAN